MCATNDDDVIVASSLNKIVGEANNPNSNVQMMDRAGRYDMYAWPMGKDCISVYEVPARTVAAIIVDGK